MSTNLWHGEKVILRAIEPEDWEACFESNQDTDIQRFYDKIYFPSSKERLRKWCQEQSLGVTNDEFRWAIQNKEGQLVGCINTFDCIPRYGCFYYGIGIYKKYQGRGYGKEAIKIVLNYFFNELRYRKVTASVYSFNEHSLQMHKNLGFQKEGHLRNMCYTNGNYYDEIVFGMTAEEFYEKYNELKPKISS